MDIEHLVFANGPERVGPFSHAVKAGEFIFMVGGSSSDDNLIKNSHFVESDYSY